MNIKRIISLLLASAVLSSVVSCGESDVNTDETNKNSVNESESIESTAEEEENDSRESIKDTLPDDLNFEGRTVTIFHSDKRNRSPYISGGEEITGDPAQDAAYNSNINVGERLNVNIEYHPDITSDYDTVGSIISTTVMSGDPTDDFVMGEMFGISQLVTKGYFYDCFNVDYFNFDMPWWNTDFMNSMSIDDSKRVFVSGDYNLTTIVDANALYMNKVIYENQFGNPDDIYGEVIEGKWTIDRMTDLVDSAYLDLNGNGIVDSGDQYGYLLCYVEAVCDAYQYCASIPYSSRDENGTISINMEQERAVTLAEKAKKLFNLPATDCYSWDNVQLFTERGTLFLHGYMYTAAKLREMEDDFAILPVPKLDEEQEKYQTHIGDCVMLDAIPVSSDSADIIGAVVEALCADAYKYIMPAYFDIAMKNKYSRDETTARVLDIIHDSINTDFIYIYTVNVGDCGRIMRSIIPNTTVEYSSSVAKLSKIINKSLEKFVNSFQDSFN